MIPRARLNGSAILPRGGLPDLFFSSSNACAHMFWDTQQWAMWVTRMAMVGDATAYGAGVGLDPHSDEETTALLVLASRIVTIISGLAQANR